MAPEEKVNLEISKYFHMREEEPCSSDCKESEFTLCGRYSFMGSVNLQAYICCQDSVYESEPSQTRKRRWAPLLHLLCSGCHALCRHASCSSLDCRFRTCTGESQANTQGEIRIPKTSWSLQDHLWVLPASFIRCINRLNIETFLASASTLLRLQPSDKSH